MHLTCTNMPRASLDAALTKVREAGRKEGEAGTHPQNNLHKQASHSTTALLYTTHNTRPNSQLTAHNTQVREAGVQNILALRGDPPKGHDTFVTVEGGFSCALDLVKYIREKHGDHFGLCVAGYPEAHPETLTDDPVANEKAYRDSLVYLKQKVRAGRGCVGVGRCGGRWECACVACATCKHAYTRAQA